jgi:hypothetical protein
MARPTLTIANVNRANYDSSVPTAWVAGNGGDWWDATGTANGTTPWASAAVNDTDTGRYITLDVTDLFQAIYDNPDHTSAIILCATGGGTGANYRLSEHSTSAERPYIVYDGGSDTAMTADTGINFGSSGGSPTVATQAVWPGLLTTGNWQRIILDVPPPGTRPTSAEFRIWTNEQFGDTTLEAYWLRYPPESAPTIPGDPPIAPTGVTSGSVTALSATASWTDASADETGFKVQYAPSPYSSWTTLSGSPTAANATSLATGNVLTDGTSYKFRVASTNANGDSAWVESGVFTTSTLTRLRPNADTTVGAWTPSTGATLFGVIDEAVADDADYITTASATTGKVKVEVSTDPADDTNHSVSIRARATSGTLTVSLVQGHPSETLIKAWTPSLTASFAAYVLTMSSGEAAGITDYSDLYLKFVTT